MIGTFIKIGSRKIAIKGIGRAFYERGYPISMGIEDAFKLGCTEVSVFHIADELLKHGWSPKTVIRKMQEEKSLDITGVLNLNNLEEFCDSEYEVQREMIYNYLNKPLFEIEVISDREEAVEIKLNVKNT